MRFYQWHKWLSLLVAIQLLIWLTTGLYFALCDHNKAAGNTYRQPVTLPEQSENTALAEISALPVSGVSVVRLFYLQNKPFYLVERRTPAHDYQLQDTIVFDATNGERIQLNEELIGEQALRSYSGPGRIISATLSESPVKALPGYKNPAWAVAMDDELATTIYLRADTAQVIAHVDNPRRLRNLMFKLHFMDYANEGSFNNLYSTLFGAMALLLTLTGLWWLYLKQKTKLSRRLWRKASDTPGSATEVQH